MKKSLLAPIALTMAAMLTTACSQEAEPVAVAPEGPEGISVENARLSLPPVAGNPAAVYFDLKNSSTKNHMVRSVSVQGAESAVLHQMGTWSNQPSMDEIAQIGATPNETLKFEPGGLHVMAMNLSDTVVAGGTAEVTLTFVGGDKFSFPAQVLAAGDAR